MGVVGEEAILPVGHATDPGAKAIQSYEMNGPLTGHAAVAAHPEFTGGYQGHFGFDRVLNVV